MENKNEFVWKLEEMVLLNKSEYELINIVENTSKETKVNFINEMNDNKLNRILEADKKWHEDMKNDVIKKDYADRPKSVSYKAWIKRNGYLNIVSDFVNGGWEDTIGEIKLLGCNRRLGYLEYIGKYDTFDSLIDELFYRQL